MSEMIERVAKAIYESRNGAGCAPWSRRPAAYKDPYMEDARAAIEAVRDPTRSMTQAGGGVILDERGPPWLAGEVWSAMISAALSQDTHSLPSEDR